MRELIVLQRCGRVEYVSQEGQQDDFKEEITAMCAYMQGPNSVNATNNPVTGASAEEIEAMLTPYKIEE